MGTFNTHGGYFAPKDYTRINEGGSHDENPNGGVQMGVAPDGAPNLLEENEPVYKDYVFSDNIKAEKKFLEENNLPTSYEGKLYSQIADHYVDEAEERPLDPISRSGLNAMLSRLSNAQEGQKQAKQMRELEQALSELSPEELEMLEAELSSAEQPEVGQPQQEQMVQEPVQAGMPMPEPMMQEEAVPQEQVPVMGCGGKVRRFDLGGPENVVYPEQDWRTYIKKGAVDLTPYMTNYTGGMTEDQLGWLLAGASGNQGQYHFYKPYPIGKDWIGLSSEETERRKRVNSEADSLFRKVQAEAENANIEAQYKERQELWNGIKNKAKSVLGNLRIFDEGGDKSDHPVQQTLLFDPETGTATIAAPYHAQTVIDEPAVVTANSPETQAMIDRIHAGTDAAARTIYDVASAGSYMTPIGPLISGADAAGHFLAGDKKGGWKGLGRTALLAATPLMGRRTASGYRSSSDAKAAFDAAYEAGSAAADGAAGAAEATASRAAEKAAEATAEAVKKTPGDYMDYIWDPVKVWKSKWFKDASGLQKVGRGVVATGQTALSGEAYSAAAAEAAAGAKAIYDKTKDVIERNKSVGTTDAFKDLKFAEGGHLFDGTESSQINREADRKYWSDMWRQSGILPGFGLTYSPADTWSYLTSGTIGSNSPEHFLHYSYGPAKVEEVSPASDSGSAPVVKSGAEPAKPALVRNEGDWEHFNLNIDPRAKGIVDRALQTQKDSVLANPDITLAGKRPVFDRPDVQYGSTALPTFSRYAKAIGSGLLGLYDVFQQPDHYEAERAIPYTPYGNINLQNQRYIPVDPNVILNAQLAQSNSTARALQNSVGPATAANLIAIDNNTTRNIGTGLLQGMQANNQQRNAVLAANNQAEAQRAQFDYGVDVARANALTMAQRQNIQNNLMTQRLNNMAEAEKYAALSNQINAGLDALAGIGRENFVMNQVNSNTALEGYQVAPNGVNGYMLVPGAKPRTFGGTLLKKYKK